MLSWTGWKKMRLHRSENEYEVFQERFGDYVNYSLNRDDVLDGFYAAYMKEKPLEQLVLIEDSAELEDDLYERFTEESNWFDSVLALLKPGKIDAEDEYAEFADDFEIEPAEDNMLYWCRYEP